MVLLPNPSADDPTAEQRTFVPLKLSGQARKRTPPGYLGLDRVLDEVGGREQPQTWGRLPGWALLPFRYDKRTRTYRVYRDLRLVEGKPAMTSLELKAKFTRDDLRACSQLYRSVCERLLAAFETFALPAYALQRPSGKLTPLKEAGLWSTQGTWAFYTGLVVVPDGAGEPVIARVLVREDDLRRWLRRDEAQDAQQQARETRRRIGGVICDFMTETACRLTREQVREVVESVLGRDTLKPKDAFADVWQALPRARGGNPGNRQKSTFDTHRETLRARVRAAAADNSATAQVG